MKHLHFLLLLISSLVIVSLPVFSGCSNSITSSTTTPQSAEKSITVFAGSASKPALDEAAAAFKKKTGISVYLTYGGSGTVLSQMKLAKSGDLYIPGSPDYIVIADRDGVIDPKSVQIISYLIPAIAVQHGNPKNIQSLQDLLKPGIKVGIGNPKAVCLGLYSIELFEYNHLLTEVTKNIITNAESCEKTAALIALKSVDAVIGWDVFHDWNPDSIDIIYLKPNQIPRIAYIPAAVSTYAKDKVSAQQFIDFLISEEGQDIFSKWGYITKKTEAMKFAPGATIGGEYKLPDSFIKTSGN